MKLTFTRVAKIAVVTGALGVSLLGTPASACTSRIHLVNEICKVVVPPPPAQPPHVDAPSLPRIDAPAIPQDVKDARDQIAALKNPTVTTPITGGVSATASRRDGIVVNADIPLTK